MAVTVGALEGLHEAVERFRTMEGLPVAISGVRVDEAQDMLVLLRRQVRTLHWRVEEGTMAALEAVADTSSRLERLRRMVDLIAGDVEEGLPRSELWNYMPKATCSATSRRLPQSLLARSVYAELMAHDLARVAGELDREPFPGDGPLAADRLEWGRSRFWETVETFREEVAKLFGRTFPLDIQA